MSPAPSTSLPRAAGALGLAHVVLLVGGLTLSGGGALIEEGTAGVERAYVEGSLAAVLLGWFVESVGFVLLVPVVVYLARSLGRTTQLGRWAGSTGLVLAGVYVATTLAVGFPAGAAAAYGVQHGLDLEAGAALNAMRVFGYLLSLLSLGGYVVCVAVSALADDFARRFVGYFGLLTGVALAAAAPLWAVALQDVPTLVYLVWWVGLCVLLLRGRPVLADDLAPILATKAQVRQA